MKRVMVIDDDRSEAVFWSTIIGKDFNSEIMLSYEALDTISSSQPEIIVLDNKVPPHTSAHYCLEALQLMNFKGKIFVWSFTDKEELQQSLSAFPEIEIICKLDYTGLKLKNFIQEHILEN